ncbi:MAG: hypothetical protein A2445_01105 [Candidatus Jacksonbacteria bacterium RIFOXYC2_FULL_44_29]|nr:MAG: Inositol monophosphatase [Parcubacteria group bacterium GW2011_GWC2_44_22]OGY76385.1 MAG: hypothetical protein A2295_04355 [Candidatus Jacksonbacteria bacterium RIFOXYB2_FULL_44_15]OGY76434.1 MAG: hypothetical protein A2240_05410 [Candidatus Jacksonbacteria bacterium RIFOXYA2_FULL_43_12]OGY77339.1 MAG: hypothetical protein A2445_01105 [Candidatus Jacksonbacteria bacterium RIFOXYC2_FULL_44_29]OGY78569.1 MAG: hypothetical protein A2550_03865 [Candidatus Jacksonbacteria bacterium RIFOXYD2_
MIELLKKTISETNELLRRYFRQELSVKHKTGAHDLVTEADVAAQKMIVERLSTGMRELGYKDSDVGFIGEEGLFAPARYTFVIDPLDGTNNFASRFPLFATSIGVFEDQKLLCGTVGLPMESAIYFGERGGGSYKETSEGTEQLSVEERRLSECLLGTYMSPHPLARARLFKIYDKLLPQIRGIRQTGSAVYDLCALVENRLNLAIYRAYIWDIAGMAIILSVAGGSFTDWQGEPLSFNLNNPDQEYFFVAGHRQTLRQALPFLKV